MPVFNAEDVERLRTVYNKEHRSESPIPSGDADDVWKALQKRLGANCKTGRAECIVSQLLRRPKAPKEWAVNREEWLSSDDIDALEANYQELFPDYFYVGTVPMDFDLQTETRKCLVSALCSMQLPELAAKGHHRIGIIINTDPHDGPGQHWVSVFCDIRPILEYPRITYFDSYAHAPEPEIKALMARWKEQWDATKTHEKPMKLTFNTTHHQYKDSECGMYCLYFHYACIMQIPMQKRIPDDVINSFRDFLFRMPAAKDSEEKE